MVEVVLSMLGGSSVRRRKVLVVIPAALAITLAVVAATSRSGSPELVIDETVAADFADVAHDDWRTFVAAFPALDDCIGRVTLVADYAIDDRAKYDPQSQTMTVRVPGPRALLDRAVIHELAHHLEFSCSSQAAMRPAFLAAIGRSDDEWFDGSEWGVIPSEIFAEAVVEYVLEERSSVHTDMGLIDQKAVELVIAWATGQ
jgi:hypothetical protein